MNIACPATIIHVDLAEGPLPGPVETDGRAAYVVLWWRGIALAHLHFPGSALPLPAGHLWNVALRAVAPTVGSYLLGDELEPSPETSATTSDPASDWAILLAGENPLGSLASAPHGQDSETISVVVCGCASG